jgi:hypothetical protein
VLDHLNQKLVLDGGDVHKHHADTVTSIRSEAEAPHVGPQRDPAARFLAPLELQEDESTARRVCVLRELEGRTLD